MHNHIMQEMHKAVWPELLADRDIPCTWTRRWEHDSAKLVAHTLIAQPASEYCQCGHWMIILTMKPQNFNNTNSMNTRGGYWTKKLRMKLPTTPCMACSIISVDFNAFILRLLVVMSPFRYIIQFKSSISFPKQVEYLNFGECDGERWP